MNAEASGRRIWPDYTFVGNTILFLTARIERLDSCLNALNIGVLCPGL